MNVPGIYRHYKGKYYCAFSRAADEDTGEVFVLYRQMYAPFGYWLRPQEMFLGPQEVNGVSVPRFEKVSDLPPDMCSLPGGVSLTHSETLEQYDLLSQGADGARVRRNGRRYQEP